MSKVCLKDLGKLAQDSIDVKRQHNMKPLHLNTGWMVLKFIILKPALALQASLE